MLEDITRSNKGRLTTAEQDIADLQKRLADALANMTGNTGGGAPVDFSSIEIRLSQMS